MYSGAGAMENRYLIKNGKIVNGKGEKPYPGSILIEDGKIKRIFRNASPGAELPGRADIADVTGLSDAFDCPADKEHVIDAEGAFITPGFIDIHRHGDWQAFGREEDELLNRQGITTVINGNCGLSAAPTGGPYRSQILRYLDCITGKNPFCLTQDSKQSACYRHGSCTGRFSGSLEHSDPSETMHAYLDALAQEKRSVNTGMLVGGGTVRASVAGYAQNTLSREQEEEIRGRFAEALSAGALGISIGLGYEPEYHYDTEGLIRVLRPLQREGKPLAVHIRTEGDGAADSVREMLRVAESLGVLLHLSHMKCIGKRNWRVTRETELKLIQEAREKGLCVSMDTYPYVTGSTQLIHLIPPEFLASGVEAFLENLKTAHFREKVKQVLSTPSSDFENIVELAGFENIAAAGLSSERYSRFEGIPIADAARSLDRDPFDVLFDILAAEQGKAAMLDTYGDEDDMIAFLKDPGCSLISDAIYPEEGARHPRVFDSFPRFLIRYVREREIFTIEEAIYKMTGLSAQLYHLERGILEEGKPADLCVFRLDHLCSDASFEHPACLCRGFDAVFTGGKPCVRADRWSNTAGGRLLKGGSA